MESSELYDALLTTRAMRRFTDESVDDATIEACLRAAVQAPSGGNIQPYQFVVVTEPERKARIGELYLQAWERYAPAVAAITPPAKDEEARRRHERGIAASDELARAMANVPVLVLVLMPKIEMVVDDAEGRMDVGPTYASVYPAVQNFILACRAHGLGTVLTTVYRIYEDAVRTVCDIPDRYEVVALCRSVTPKAVGVSRPVAPPLRSPTGTASASGAADVTFRFTAPLWLWQGNAAWHFLTVPAHISDEIEGRTSVLERRGFGSVRVKVTIGTSTWTTSVFPDKNEGAYVLPVKKAVRADEGLAVGKKAKVVLELLEA